MENLAEQYSPFIREIRTRILVIACVFIVAMIGGFVFYENIIKILIDVLSLRGINIVFTSPFQFINLAISCSIAMGLVCVFPLVTIQILAFLKPALRKDEFRMVLRLLPFSLILFVMGFSFGIVVMKWQIQLFLTKSVSLGIGNVLDISQLISTVLLVSVFMGIAFEFPIILLLLMRIGVVKHGTLRKQRLWVYLGSLLFAILLPIDSIVADVLLALPLIIMYEGTILMHRMFKKDVPS